MTVGYLQSTNILQSIWHCWMLHMHTSHLNIWDELHNSMASFQVQTFICKDIYSNSTKWFLHTEAHEKVSDHKFQLVTWRYMGSGGIAPYILNLGTKWEWLALSPSHSTPRERSPVPTEEASQLVWMLWRRLSCPCR
jgi:hypothetical protein